MRPIIVLLLVTLFAGEALADSLAQAPGSVSQESNGSLQWSSLSQAKTADGFYASAGEAGGGTFTTNTLVFNNFGFAVPASASITGVKVTLLRAGAQTITDNGLVLDDGAGGVSDNKADITTVWPSSFTEKSYGADSDSWGMTLTPTLINSSTFSIRFAATVSSPHNLVLAEARIDAVTMTVYFTPNGGGAPGVHHRKRGPVISQVRGRSICIEHS